MSRRRELLLNLLLSLASIVVCLLAAEIVLRFLPVSTGLRSVPVTAADPILHFTPNRPFVNSLGWNMHNVVHGRVNNAGFVNDQDYVRDGPPLIAVIGDSFIEAQMVAYPQTLQGRLAAALAPKFRVYSFAGSGAPLKPVSDLGGLRREGIRRARRGYQRCGERFRREPCGATASGQASGSTRRIANGVLHLKLTPHRAGTLISLARQSALARYVIINLGIQNRLFSIRWLAEMIFGKPANAQPRYAGNTDASTDEKRVRDLLAAIDAFFRDVPERVGLPPERVLFTLDGFRNADAARDGQGTYFDLMRRAFIEKAAAKGYEVIDLDTRFIPRHARTGESFEFHEDNHWNAAGHEVAFEAVMASKLLARLRQ